ncbi:MAG: AmmeMemoRadiSam system protein B [Anaerolineales bacterium]|nr:AmmeMemoRadiSam system protein B [Anaerolineales bacterium]
MPDDLRPSPIAGRWYPGDAASLARLVDDYLAQAPPPAAAARVVGVLAPHAGLLYSGPVAAHAFQWVRGQAFEVVVILSPSHFHADGPVLTSAHAAYTTPLGAVPVDQPLLAQIRARLAAALNTPAAAALPALAYDREHAIEMELPFLQRVLAPGFQLAPLMLREQTAPVAAALGALLGELLAGRRALLVVSSDLSHYYPQAEAERLDQALLAPVAAFDPAAVLAVHAAGRGYACGAGALAAGLWAAGALGAHSARVVGYATSGAVSGDYAAVVGYAAAVFLA